MDGIPITSQDEAMFLTCMRLIAMYKDDTYNKDVPKLNQIRNNLIAKYPHLDSRYIQDSRNE